MTLIERQQNTTQLHIILDRLSPKGQMTGINRENRREDVTLIILFEKCLVLHFKWTIYPKKKTDIIPIYCRTLKKSVKVGDNIK